MMNFFRGRVSMTWKNIQGTHMKRAHVPTRRRGASWMFGFIRQLYKWSRLILDNRNDIIHRRDAAAQDLVVLSDTDQKIINEFELGISGIRVRDQYVLTDNSMSVMLSKRFEDKLNWLRHMKVIRQRSLRAERSQMDRMRNFMEKWKHRRKI